MKRKYGFLTEKQYRVLELRLRGYTQERIARLMGTSRENIAMIEKKAMDNIRRAQETLEAYEKLLAVGEVDINPGTRLVDIPGIVVRRADELGVKLKTNFTRLYDEIRYVAEAARRNVLEKRIKILIFRDGSFSVAGGGFTRKRPLRAGREAR